MPITVHAPRAPRAPRSSQRSTETNERCPKRGLPAALLLLTAVAAIGCSDLAPPSARPPAGLAALPIERSLLPRNVLEGRSLPAWSLAERMTRWHVPAVALAILDDGEIAAVRQWGTPTAGSPSRVDGNTLFQAGSISKTLTAVAALRLVQEGRLDLDQDINDLLDGWKLRDESGAAVGGVSPALLLRHRAGTNVHGFPGYAVGTPLPTLLQVLDGISPANSPPVRVVVTPDSETRYSGGGYEVLQLALTRLGGEPFVELSRRLVLAPLGMVHSTFSQPLPEALAERAATAHDGDGIPLPGRWHVYPEQAAAGLWTTAEDLARFVLAAMGSSDPAGTFLRSDLRGRMLPEEPGAGLGFFVGGQGESAYLLHDGAVEGAQAILVGFPETGRGAVVLTNSDNGLELAYEVLRGLAVEYGWPAFGPKRKAAVDLPPPANRTALAGAYVAASDGSEAAVRIVAEGDSLFAESTYWAGRRALYLDAAGAFFTLEGDWDMRFERDPRGRVSGMRFGPVEFLRVKEDAR